MHYCIVKIWMFVFQVFMKEDVNSHLEKVLYIRQRRAAMVITSGMRRNAEKRKREKRENEEKRKRENEEARKHVKDVSNS